VGFASLESLAFAVVAFSGSGVLVLLLGLLLPGVRALICIMLGLSTIVAKAGRKFFVLGNLLLIFLDDTELLPFSLS
jgi:membrane protein DedA with SNARE-associated domain